MFLKPDSGKAEDVSYGVPEFRGHNTQFKFADWKFPKRDRRD